MSLRTRILLFLFIFALVPLLMAVVINLPLVLDRVDNFYRQTYLHDLRQDFRDLDQHLASRDANVRLLARLPEPSLFAPGRGAPQARVDLERVRYTEWVNRILRDETDIREIRFLDRDARQHFGLVRNPRTGAWYAPPSPLPALPATQLQAIRSGELKDVAYTPVRVGRENEGGSSLLTLQMMAPIRLQEKYWGAVVITVDISDLVRQDPKTLWVLDNGRYLDLARGVHRTGNAFDQYPGLAQLFRARKPVLWEKGDQRMIWVPMFVTESGRPLWVGRRADTSQLVELRNELVHRVLAIVFGLIILLLIAARMIAKRMESISSELIQGIHETLETNRPVRFNWTDTHELEQLSADLTRLSRRHATQARRLLEHNQELEESNRYKSEFLANVSHELRTPLNSILLLSKMLTSPESGLPEEQREQAAVVYKAANDLKGLIENILDLSKIEAGQFEVHIEDVELRPLLDDLRELMQPQFDQKGLELVFELQDGVPQRIRSDPGKIRQILKNFLANALKFTAAGEVRVSVRAASPPRAVELAVSDTGIGIPRGKQAHIFDAFKQADGSTSRRYGGTGLGLTISRQLAQLLHGDIELHSEPGRGATFSLLLPEKFDQVVQPQETVPKTQQGPASENESMLGDKAAVNLSGRRVLLLVADVRAQLHLSQSLQKWHAAAVLACDREEAQETIEAEGRPDILVFDPRILGARPCDTIKQLLQGGRNAPLLLGIGRPAEIGCDREDGLVWLEDVTDEATLHRLLAEWEIHRSIDE